MILRPGESESLIDILPKGKSRGFLGVSNDCEKKIVLRHLVPTLMPQRLKIFNSFFIQQKQRT